MGLLNARTLATALAAAGACTTDVAVDLSRVDGPRLLAVAAEPAQARPNATVTLSALWVDETGTVADAPLLWSLCSARRPLAELGPVAEACIEGVAEVLAPLGQGPEVTAGIPAMACRLFGPDPPPAEPGQPQGRPVEPDITGGYYQPVVVDTPGELAVFGVRLDCGIAGTTQAQSAELRRRHRNNVSPVLEGVWRMEGDDAIPIEDGSALAVSAGDAVALRVRWPGCAQAPTCGDGQCTLDEDGAACPDDCADGAGCGGAEWYASFDPAALEVTVAREAIGVAWYGTGGKFDTARTGRDADDTTRTSDNVWTAPDDAGVYSLWIVVRDDRGGTSWRALTAEVAP